MHGVDSLSFSYNLLTVYCTLDLLLKMNLFCAKTSYIQNIPFVAANTWGHYIDRYKQNYDRNIVIIFLLISLRRFC